MYNGSREGLCQTFTGTMYSSLCWSCTGIVIKRLVWSLKISTGTVDNSWGRSCSSFTGSVDNSMCWSYMSGGGTLSS